MHPTIPAWNEKIGGRGQNVHAVDQFEGISDDPIRTQTKYLCHRPSSPKGSAGACSERAFENGSHHSAHYASDDKHIADAAQSFGADNGGISSASLYRLIARIEAILEKSQ